MMIYSDSVLYIDDANYCGMMDEGWNSRPRKDICYYAVASEQHMTTGFHNIVYARGNRRTVRNCVFCRARDNIV